MRRANKPLVALVALMVALAVGYAIHASNGGSSGRHMSTVPLSSLPPQAIETVRLIQHGGPFPYPHSDGAVFHNLEHRLPREPDGYYREYTVPTPGSPDRGARRIIAGAHGEYFYTADHYESFQRVEVSP